MIVAMFSKGYLAQDYFEISNSLTSESIAINSLYVHDDSSIALIQEDARFVYRVAACARDLAAAKNRHDYIASDSFLLVYDFPLLVAYESRGDFLQELDFGGRSAIEGISEEEWRLAKMMMNGAYLNARFDYVFSYPDGPTSSELAKCGIISDLVDVTTWRDVAEFLKVVVCK